jgi:hypothetical protein
MADPILYYDITLINGTFSESYIVPWVISLDANPQNEVVVLQSTLGNYAPGMYVGYNGVWKFAIPYEPITQAIIQGANITVVYNSTQTIDFDMSHSSAMVYQNGVAITQTTVTANLISVYGAIQTNEAGSAVYSVNNVLPDATGNVEINIDDIPNLADDIASTIWTVNGVGPDSNHGVNVYLRTLPDVNVNESPTIDGYLLRYSSTIGQWVAENPNALDIIHSVNGQTGGGTGNVVVQALPAETPTLTDISLIADSGATTGNILIKTLIGYGGIDVVDNGTNVTLEIPSYVQSVQSTTEAGGTTLVANDGSITQVAQIKELVAGVNVNFSNDGNSVTINATNSTGGGGTLVAVQSTGTGTSLVNYDGSGATPIALLKSLAAGANVTITTDANNDTVTISAATALVSSVNGLTGAVVLNNTNITGFATVAYTGNYSDLNGLPTPYSLPIASSQTLGGIKIGANLTIAGDGTLSANAQQLVPATTTTLGGVIIGPGLTVQADGTIAVVPYSLSAATTTSLGGIIVGTTLSVANDGTLNYNLAPATTSTLGGVIVGSGIQVAMDGTISTQPLVVATTTTLGGVIVPTSGGLSVDSNGNLSINAADVVTSVNASPGDVTIVSGAGVTVSTSGSVITISAAGATGGTVTEVALGMPSIFAVSGSPVTTTGTLTATLVGQTANMVFAGPASGSANIPSFRALVGKDLPTATTSTTGVAYYPTGSGLLINPATGSVQVDENYNIISFNGRVGNVTLQTSDVTAVGGVTAGANTTFTGSNIFSGSIQVPTQPSSDNSDLAASTAFVQTAIADIATGVTSFNTRVGAVTFQASDISGVGGALLNSPTFTGNPQSVTQAPASNSSSIATTAFVHNVLASYATLAGPAFTGVPTAPTAAMGTNTTQLATTAFVQAAITTNAGVTTFNGRNGAVTLTSSDITGAGGALLNSPALTGTPTAPTATAGTNTTQIATTAFVLSQISSGAVSSFNTRTGAVTLQLADVTGVGGAPLASPAFTGVPTAPTPSDSDNSTTVATTAFVQAVVQNATIQPATTTTLGGIIVGSGLTVQTNGTLSANVTSVAGRTGAVVLAVGDVSGAAPLASPAFTGVPTGPNANIGTNTTQLATTTYVINQNRLCETSVAVAATGTTPIGAASAYPVIQLTGTLSANVFVSIPSPGNWTFYNGTTGGTFTVTLTNGGTGPTFVMQQASSTQVYSDASLGVVPVITAGLTTASTDNSNNLATTSFVHTLLGGGSNVVNSFNTRVGVVTLQASDVSGVGGALLSGTNTWNGTSNTFSTTVTAPTVAFGDNTTNVATTAFVDATINSTLTFPVAAGNNGFSGTNALYRTIYVTGSLTGAPTITIPLLGNWIFYNQTTNGSGGPYALTITNGDGGTTFSLAQGGTVHIVSNGTIGVYPAVTVGITQAPTDNSNNLATTAYVQDVLGLGTGVVTSFNTRSGAVTLQASDVSGVGGALLSGTNTWSANQTWNGATNAFSNTVTLPTAAVGTSSTVAASTAYVMNALQATTTLNVASLSSPYTLLPTQYGQTIIELTGNPASAITLVFPTSGQWIIYNNTGGSNNVTLSNTFGATYVALRNESSSVLSLGSLGIVNSNISAFTLTPATVSTLGGVIVPNNSGLTVDASGNLAVSAATSSTAGIVSQGSGVTISSSGVLSANVTSVFGRTGAVVLTLADVTGVGGAPINSPTFTGTPAAATAGLGTNSTQLATTNYVYTFSQPVNVPLTGYTSSYQLLASQYSSSSIVFTGTVAAGGLSVVMPINGTWDIINNTTGGVVTLTSGTGANLTLLQSTSVIPVVSTTTGSIGIVTVPGGGSTVVNSFNTRSGAVTLQAADVTGVGGALLAGPAFTGTPTAPTAGSGTNNTQLATTGYVYAATQGSQTIPLASTTPVVLTPAQYSVPVLVFTGTLTTNIVVTVPTTGEWIVYNATSGAFTVTLSNGVSGGATQMVPQSAAATSPYISNATAGVIPVTPVLTGVSSFNTRTGAVTLQASDVTGVGGALLTGTNAWTGGNSFTGGSITMTTQGLGTNNTTGASTGYVYAATQTPVSVPVSNANVTLSAAQYSAPIVVFTGTLTAAITVTVPVGGAWEFVNQATGAFTITISNGVTSGTTVGLPQSSASSFTHLVSDSTGIVGLAASGVSSFNTRTGAVTLQLTDVTGVGGAPIASPTFTGVVQSPASTYTISNLGSVSGTVTINVNTATEFQASATAATSFVFAGTPAAGIGEVVYMRLAANSNSIAWPGTTLFPGGIAPAYSTGTDLLGIRYDATAGVYSVFTIGLALAT